VTGNRPRVAVGLVDVAGMDLVQQVAARLQLLEVAQTQGYTLVQVLELGERRRDSDVYAAALNLARRADARAFLLHGDVDPARLDSHDLPTAQIIAVTGLDWYAQPATDRPTLATLVRGHARHEPAPDEEPTS